MDISKAELTKDDLMKTAWQSLVEESKVHRYLPRETASPAAVAFSERFFDIIKPFCCMSLPYVIDSETTRELCELSKEVSDDSWRMILRTRFPVWLCQNVCSQQEEDSEVRDRMLSLLECVFLQAGDALRDIDPEDQHTIVVCLARTIETSPLSSERLWTVLIRFARYSDMRTILDREANLFEDYRECILNSSGRHLKSVLPYLRFLIVVSRQCSDESSVASMAFLFGEVFKKGTTDMQLLALRGLYGLLSQPIDHSQICLRYNLHEYISLGLWADEKPIAMIAFKLLYCLAQRSNVHKLVMIPNLTCQIHRFMMDPDVNVLVPRTIELLVRKSSEFRTILSGSQGSGIVSCLMNIITSESEFSLRSMSFRALIRLMLDGSLEFRQKALENGMLEAVLHTLTDGSIEVIELCLVLVCRTLQDNPDVIKPLLIAYKDSLYEFTEIDYAPNVARLAQLACNQL